VQAPQWRRIALAPKDRDQLTTAVGAEETAGAQRAMDRFPPP